MKLRALTRPLRHSRAAALLSKLNGILFPGGGADLSQASQFIATASLAFNTSVAAALAGETFPVWGTCLVRRNARALALAADYVAQGFQTVCTVASRNFSLLEEYDAENISLPLTWTADPSKSRWAQPSACLARALCEFFVLLLLTVCSGCSGDCRLLVCQP